MNEETLFREKGIRPTAIRLLVWRAAQQLDYAFSLTDLETALETVDKSTIFRTLSLFEERHLLHIIDDGSGSQKYCLCNCVDSEHHQHHVHITCTVCKKTYCLKTQQVPQVGIPEGFEVEQINYVIKGVCADCRKQHGRCDHCRNT